MELTYLRANDSISEKKKLKPNHAKRKSKKETKARIHCFWVIFF